jgi:hypothetical protein
VFDLARNPRSSLAVGRSQSNASPSSRSVATSGIPSDRLVCSLMIMATVGAAPDSYSLVGAVIALASSTEEGWHSNGAEFLEWGSISSSFTRSQAAMSL